MKPTLGQHIEMGLYVGSASSHVGRHRDAPRLAGTGNDLCLITILPGVENERLKSFRDQQFGKIFGGLDRSGADKYRPSVVNRGLRGLYDGTPLLFSRVEYAGTSVSPA